MRHSYKFTELLCRECMIELCLTSFFDFSWFSIYLQIL